jgi:hypothetical protein
MTFIDLKSVWRKWEDAPAIKEDRSHEFRKNHFLPVGGFSSSIRISTVRATLQWQLQSQKLLLLGPIPLDGFCPVN